MASNSYFSSYLFYNFSLKKSQEFGVEIDTAQVLFKKLVNSGFIIGCEIYSPEIK